jgi:DNA repair exonuclease SbcCD ATPase subunit
MGPEEGDEPTPEVSQEQEPQVEQETQEVEETPRYRVKAAGEEREVSLDDLIKSYQLGTDYTQKTQALAEQRKAIEAEKAAVEQAKSLRDQYAQRLELIEKVLSEQNKTEDIEHLKETDPIGYAVKVAELSQREKQLTAVQAERSRLAQQQQAEHQQKLQEVLAQEAEKVSQAIPEWNTEKGEDVRKDIRAYAKGLGFSDQELSQVYDSRAVLTLWKAAQYDKLISNKPEVTKKVSEAPKMMKPGTAKVSNPESDALKAERNRLRKSGKARDAATIFERFLA